MSSKKKTDKQPKSLAEASGALLEKALTKQKASAKDPAVVFKAVLSDYLVEAAKDHSWTFQGAPLSAEVIQSKKDEIVAALKENWQVPLAYVGQVPTVIESPNGFKVIKSTIKLDGQDIGPWNALEEHNQLQDVLQKAGKKAPHALHYGSAHGLPIIAIGPNGGKIVGYKHGDVKHPIYAGSSEAFALAAAAKSTAGGDAWLKPLQAWLEAIGAHHSYSPKTETLHISDEHWKPLALLGVPSTSVPGSGIHNVTLEGIKPFIGKAPHPPADEHLDWAAASASGTEADPTFTGLEGLKEIPAGKAAGSHGNKLYQAPDGRKFLFKPANPTIAAAEEAASRLGRLILGPNAVQSAKSVTLHGEDGVLIAWVNDAQELGPEHKTNAPTTANLQKHFDELAAHQVLDWLVSNHDAHGGNFLVAGGKAVAIDKGQAWKHIGSDSLDGFNPNPSTQVYKFLWAKVKAGEVTGDPVPPIAKALQKLQAISPEQFKAIVAPYIALRAGHSGEDPAELEKKLVGRLTESASNWEWFLDKIYPGKGKGQELKAALSAPTELPPVVKGNVTLFHPGGPHPAGWPSGYPGPGYRADVLYKKQTYKVLFTHEDGAMKVRITFPDGQIAWYDSPNKASDAAYLWSKQLPLDMGAKEKKEKGISYPATKFLGLALFAEEFKAAHAAPPPAVDLTVKQLEEAKVVEPTTVSIPFSVSATTSSNETATVSPGIAANTLQTSAPELPQPAPLAEGPPPSNPPSHFDTSWEILEAQAPKGSAITSAPKQTSWWDSQPEGTTVSWIDGEDDATSSSPISVAVKKDGIWEVQWGAGAGKGKYHGNSMATQMTEALAGLVAVNPPAETPTEAEEPTKSNLEHWLDAQTVPSILKKEIVKLPDGLLGLKIPDGLLESLHPGSAVSWAAQGGIIRTAVLTSSGWMAPDSAGVYATGTADQLKLMIKLSATQGELAITHAPSFVHEPAKPKKLDVVDLAALPVGTQVKGGIYGHTFTKHPIGWKGPEESISTVALAGHLSFGPDAVVTPPASAPPPKALSDMGLDDIAALPVGTQITSKKHDKSWTKTADGVWTADSDLGGSPTLWDPGWGTGFLASPVSNKDVWQGVQPFQLQITSMGSGSSPKKAPPAHQVIPPTVAPVDLPPAQGNKVVSAQQSFADAFKDLPEVKAAGGNLKLKPVAAGMYNVCLDKTTGDVAAELQAFLDKYNLTKVYPQHPKSNAWGAFATVTAATAQGTQVSVEMPAKDVPALAVQPNNFETMPEPEQIEKLDPKALENELKNHPKKICKSWPQKKLLDALAALPSGAKLTTGSGKIWLKKTDGHWHLQNPNEGAPSSWHTKSNGGIAAHIQYDGTAVVTAGDNTIFVPQPKPPAPVQWKPPPPDPEKQAKLVWAQEHPAITSEHAEHLAWWLQKNGLAGEEIIARTTPAGNLILSGSPAVQAFLEKKGDHVALDTPHGKMWAVSWPAVKQATPEATTIQGPDGATYPHGTTFETKTTHKTLLEQLPKEQGFTKFSEYKAPDGKPSKFSKTVKISGTSPAHKMMAEAMLKKYGLESPIVQGGANTMFFVSAEALSSPAGDPEVTVTATPPKKAKPLVQKYLAVASGKGNEGQPAPNNRLELASADSLVPNRHGYSIRFGAGGVLMDGQLRMHRVKRSDGITVNRFVGELARPGDDGSNIDGMNTHINIELGAAQNLKAHPIIPGWKDHDFDPKTGTSTFSQASVWSDCQSYGAELADGAKVFTFHPSNLTMNRTFVVDVPVGMDAEKALAGAMERLKVPAEDAMAVPDDVDQRILIKMQALRSYHGASGYQEVAKLNLATKPKAEREAVLDEALKGKVAKKWIDSARVVVGHDGFHHVEMDDLNDKIGSTAHALVTGISIEGAFNAIYKGGYGGQVQNLWNGNSMNLSSTTSGEADMMGGGSVGRFFRMISTSNQSTGGSKGASAKLVVHPRVLAKTNWYGANGDNYGHQPGGNQYSPGIQRTRPSALTMDSVSNEVCVENVSSSDMVGLIVGNHSQRQQFIALAKKAGMNEINGCPVEQFVIVGSTNTQLSSTIKKLPLMQGVIP